MNSAEKFPCVISKLAREIYKMRNSVIANFLHSKNSIDRVAARFVPVIDKKRANCGEYADLTTIMARINGIKDCIKVSLIGSNGFDYDHAVVLVNDKKPYIIDAWLGFADYVPNAIKRYQKEFRNYFDFKQAKNEKMFVDSSKSSEKFINAITSEIDLLELKYLFPQMVIKKKK